MNKTTLYIFGIIVFFGVVAYLQHAKTGSGAVAKPVISFPALGQPQKLPGGIDFYTVTSADTSGRKLWIYLPENRGSSKIPCVFIAPAGSSCIAGMSLGEGDQPEHLPYVQAGFAVVAYDLDGAFDREASNRQILHAINIFRAVDGGVVNGKAAIDYALANIPAIDSQRLYSAGHSSAGTVSLLLAEKDQRIKACIAYAPVFNVAERTDRKTVSYCERRIPDFQQYLTQISPSTYLKQLTCPVFVFHADDDSNVERSAVEPYVEQLKQLNPNTQYVTVPTGDHYDSMISDGVPRAITWLQQLSK